MKTYQKLKLIKTAKIAVKAAPIALAVYGLVVAGGVQPLNVKDNSPWTSG
ncbi:MAG: hypothetical protein GU359_06150 [Desulfurococcales archaeon]|jgi:hypothetical protein|nr:hypothetical protein [Desulfurococcales archaeon]